MEKYNYLETVIFDAKEYITNNYDINNLPDYEKMYDDMMIADSVTGKASGSYYCNSWMAENALCHNNNLLAEAAEKLGYNKIPRKWLEDAKTADVVIRCYVLNQAIEEAINQLLEEKENNH